MSAEPSKVIPAQARALGPMQVMIVGRVQKARRHNGRSYTKIIIPAKDAFSRPSMVEVRSKQRVGEVGEDVRVLAEVGGYGRRPYKVTDEDTGEMRTVEPVEITLDAVE